MANPKLIQYKDDWPELFQYQEKYRVDHSITADQFLKQLGISINAKPYLYSPHKIPSNQSNTLGENLRDKLLKLKEGKLLLESVEASQPQTTQEAFSLFYESHSMTLMRLGVEMMEFKIIDKVNVLFISTFESREKEMDIENYVRDNLKSVGEFEFQFKHLNELRTVGNMMTRTFPIGCDDRLQNVGTGGNS